VDLLEGKASIVSGGVKMHEKWRLEDAGRGDVAMPPAPSKSH
jgi:hypothetical protein